MRDFLPLQLSKNITVTIIILLLALPLAGLAGDGIDIADMDLDRLLDDIVVSASKKAERLEETPANVFVITRDMIENFGCQNIGEALSLAPGLYITNDYSLSQIGIRGVSEYGDWNSHVLVLIDGRPTCEQYGGTSSIDNIGLDIDNIDRIEVVKGPSSSLYGSNAFYGLINLISKNPDEENLTVATKYSSELDIRTISLSLSQKVNPDLSFLVTGSLSDQEGNKLYFPEFSDFADSSMFALDADGYNQYYLDSGSFTEGWADKKNTLDKYSLYSTLNYHGLYAMVHVAKMNTGIAHSMWGSVFNRSENKFKEQKINIDLGFKHQFSSTIDWKASLGYDHYTWVDYILYNYGVADPDGYYSPGPIWQDWEHDRAMTASSQVHISVTPSYDIIAGAEVQFHTIRHESGETDRSGEIISENVIPKESVENKGRIYNLYIQNDYSFGNHLKIVGGLHLNHYTYTTGKAMPKAALVYTPYSAGTYKLIVGRGFKSPSFYELTFTDGTFYAANPDLKPELITNYEVVASHSLPHGLYLDIAANYSRVTNQIVQTIVDSSDPDHPGGDFLDEISQFHNIGRRQIRSAELTIRRKSVYRLSGLAGITYQEVSSTEESAISRQFNSPRWLGNAGLNYQLVPERLNASVRVSYIAHRYTWDGSQIPEMLTIDMSLCGTNIIRGTAMTVGIKNLLNRDNPIPFSYDYAPSRSIQGTGRSLYIRLESSIGI
ncbi:MAG: hypothetical protein CVT49_09455 [candidate division Zixibacteria bacterium HGW-Zixibacteria-1]|nr:MAG: hypothetical protein CVT49_09455 [candidate division Zixibacteria bacterium HGW-Zixibacteria-1]